MQNLCFYEFRNVFELLDVWKDRFVEQLLYWSAPYPLSFQYSSAYKPVPSLLEEHSSCSLATIVEELFEIWKRGVCALLWDFVDRLFVFQFHFLPHGRHLSGFSCVPSFLDSVDTTHCYKLGIAQIGCGRPWGCQYIYQFLSLVFHSILTSSATSPDDEISVRIWKCEIRLISIFRDSD